jgi:hypothetical protein
MNTKLVVAAGVGIVGAVVVVLVVHARSGSPHHHKADTTNVHANGIDDSDTSASMTAMLNAPDGATPCETAYAAVEAEQSAAKLRGSKSIFQWVAPKADFQAQCQTLAPEAQSCMMPRYRRDHRDDCARVRPSSDVLKKLVVGVPVEEPHEP